MVARLQDAILYGTRAGQPAATAVAVGTVYAVSDEGGVMERSDGTDWQSVGGTVTAAPVAAVGPYRVDAHPFFTPLSEVGWSNLNLQTNCLYGWRLLSSSAQDDEISFDVSLDAGTWRIDLAHQTSSNRGICHLYIDDVQVGTVDQYSGSQVDYVLGAVTGVVVAASGRHTLKLKMATKNGSSSGYYGTVSGLVLIRTA